MKNLYTKVVSVILVTWIVSLTPVYAAVDESAVPEPFRGETPSSQYEIYYDDLTSILTKAVLVTGRSTRQRIGAANAPSGTRFKVKKNVYTALEGNRFFFDGFEKGEALDFITKIRKSLEAMPTTAPLKHFNAKEQIAYWLNLYNVTLIEQMAQKNRNNMKKLLKGKKSLLNKKILTVSGVPLSLNDIHYNILAKKWGDNPLIIYGLYQGIIAGPNIRKKAFTGRSLFSQLRSNAKEFINSNRGTMSKGKGVLNVSNIYERNKMFFPDFVPDIKKHMSLYIEGDVGYALDEATKIKPVIKDWTVASVASNTREFGKAENRNSTALSTAIVQGGKVMGAAGGTPSGGGFSSSVSTMGSMAAASLADRVKSHARFSPDQLEMLMRLNAERKKRTGTVDIEEVKDDKDQ